MSVELDLSSEELEDRTVRFIIDDIQQKYFFNNIPLSVKVGVCNIHSYYYYYYISLSLYSFLFSCLSLSNSIFLYFLNKLTLFSENNSVEIMEMSVIKERITKAFFEEKVSEW